MEMNKRALILMLLGCASSIYGWAQAQSVRIVQGSAITLRADAANVLSYLWFKNGDPIDGYHNQRLTVTEAGTYTVMALGIHCHSEPSAPVEVIVDPETAPIAVDMAIQGTADQQAVVIGSLFNYQLFVVNNSENLAVNVEVRSILPDNVSVVQVTPNPVNPATNRPGAITATEITPTGPATYNPATRELRWHPGDIPGGGSASLSIQVRAESEGEATMWSGISHGHIEHNPADNETSVSVAIIPLQVPNTFTPNGDGLNDYLEIQGLAHFSAHRLVVFNRWGNEVYKSTSYQNNWDGGNLHEGTYYYVLELRLHSGQWQTFKGFVTLVRNVRN